MTGHNIICFAKDWSEEPTSNNHVMVRLARENRVLWLNSIATRAPKLTSRRDIGKIKRKLADFFRGPKPVSENMWVYTPLVLPFPHSRVAASLNRWILRMTLSWLRRRLQMPQFQLWTFLPNVEEFVGKLGESVVVYYCTDEWSGFSYVDGEKIARTEAKLCQRADLIFATSRRLLERKRAYNPETYLARHGVDYALFSGALDESTVVPDDLASLSQPVIGFYGTIQDWVDLDLIAHLAEKHPEWSIALLGQVFVDISRFEKVPNVHFLGRKPHSQLPNYCKGFAVGIIPYLISDRILDVNPLKMREYLCAGLPVVSAPLPEVIAFHDDCCIAQNHEEFERGIAEALRTDTAERRVQRSQTMQGETWDRKVEEAGARVVQALAKRRSSTETLVLESEPS